MYSWDITTSILEKKRPPYLNSTSGFDFGYMTAIGMLFCIRLPNIIQIGPHIAEIWRHFSFSRWRPRPLNTTSGFLFVDAAVFRRSKSISIPNFIDIISIRGWDITTYVFENKPSPYGNSTSGFDFGYVTAVGMLFCIRLQNFVQIRPPTVEIIIIIM